MARNISIIYDPRVTQTRVAGICKACLEDLFKLGLPNTQEGMDAISNFANVSAMLNKFMDEADDLAGRPRSHVFDRETSGGLANP